MSRSSTARYDDTSAILELRFRVIGFDKGLVILMGTHRSPHIGVITRLTRMFLGLVLEVQGSTMTVLPGDTDMLLDNLPHTRCSC